MIYFEKSTNTFYLESKDVTYAFCITKFGFLNHLYYGKKIAREDLSHSIYYVDRGHGSNIAGAPRHESLNIYGNECPAFGRSDYRQSMIALCDKNGVRVGDWKYVEHRIIEEKQELTLLYLTMVGLA